MSDIDVEPRNRSAMGAVIIAVIFLAVLGTGVGIVLGSQAKKDNDGDNVANNTTTSASPSPTVTATETPDPGNTDATRTRTPTGGNKTYRPTAKNDCPQQTDEAVGADLSVVLYIKTNRSEVWICEGGGRTVYQGHVLGGGFPAATSSSTLFIGSVHYEAGIYAATNGDTTYYVSPERLRITKNGNDISNEPAVETYPG
jgi:hypothetical protein